MRHVSSLCSGRGRWKKKLHQQPQTKKGGRKRQCPALCEVCLRPSAISADVTHAVGVADLAPATEHAEASLFAPFAVVVAVLAPEARLFAPFGQLNLFLRLWVSVDFGEVLFVHACSWLVQRDPGMSQIYWLILVVLSPPFLEPLTLPFYCSPVPVLKNRLNSRSEVMILSRAQDALQTIADTRFQRKGQGRGLKNTHKPHFAFPRLPEVVKIKGMHGTPDRTAWTSPSHGEKKRKVLLPEQAWRPQTITAELDSSLPRHWTRLERSWTTVGQPKPCETSTRAVVRRALVAESGKKGRARGSEADLAQCGALALPPPFLCLWLLVQFFFQRPLVQVSFLGDVNELTVSSCSDELPRWRQWVDSVFVFRWASSVTSMSWQCLELPQWRQWVDRGASSVTSMSWPCLREQNLCCNFNGMDGSPVPISASFQRWVDR